MTLNILHIMTGFELGYPGGITKYVHQLCKSQLELGAKVSVACEPSRSYTADGRIKIHEITTNPYTRFGFRIERSNSTDQALFDAVQKSNADIIHIHSIYGLSFSGLEIIRASKKPYIVTMHDYYLICPRITMVSRETSICRNVDLKKCRRCISNIEGSSLVKRLLEKVNIRLRPIPFNTWIDGRNSGAKIFLQNATNILSVSSRVAEILSQSPMQCQSKVATIGNDSYAWEFETKTASEKIRVAFLGTLTYHKGADVFFKMVKDVKNESITFHFYGRCGHAESKKMDKLGVINHGPYQGHELQQIVRDIDIGLVLPVWEDNGPQVVMELINSGTPLIATDRGGIGDLVPLGSGHTFDPDDNLAFSNIISWFNTLDRPELNAFEKRKLKSPAVHAMETLEVYRSSLVQHNLRQRADSHA